MTEVLQPPVLLAKRLFLPTASGWHSHPAGQWISSPHAIVSLETEEGQWIAFPGQAIVVGSHVPHDLHWYGTDHVASVYLAPHACLSASSPCRLVEVSAFLQVTVETLIGEEHPYDPSHRAGMLAQLIADEMNVPEQPLFGLPTPSTRPLRLLCRQLKNQPDDTRDLDQWAAFIGMSRRTLTRRFRDETGMSLLEWRQRVRAVHACRLAIEGKPIKQIAAATGYASSQALRNDVMKTISQKALTLAGLNALRAKRNLG